MARILRCMLIAVCGLLFAGCTTDNYKRFYKQTAPTEFPETENVNIFTYMNVNIDDIYNVLFSDFLIIGRSDFIGPFQAPSTAADFARSIGSDIFLSTSQFEESITEFMPLTLPDVQTSYISGYSGQGSFYGTATTYSTRTYQIPVTVNRYTQNGIFLKNIAGGVPLWERKKRQYRRTTPAPQFDGVWFNDNYSIELYRSGDQIVGFVVTRTRGGDRDHWKRGDLKLFFGPASGKGVYLAANRTPIPATFMVNRFGHLEVSLVTVAEKFSFARKK